MGQNNSKSPVQSITNEVTEIRRSIRRDKGRIDHDSKEQLQKVLINYSQEVNSHSKKAKKKDVDRAQKLISEVTTELLLDSTRDENLDMAAVETNSFIHLPKVEKPARQQRINDVTTPSLSTLNEIENKLESLKTESKVAIANNDKAQMRFLLTSTQNLATDLELIPTEEHIILNERKQVLEKNLKQVYNKLHKARRQVSRDNNIQYLTELHDKEKREQCLTDLDDVAKAISAIKPADLKTTDKLQAAKDKLTNYRARINSTEELSREIQSKKEETLDLLQKQLQAVENAIVKAKSELNIEEKLQQAENSHKKLKAEIDRFSNTTNSEDYQNFRKYLAQLKDYVTKIPVANQKIEERKRAFLEDVGKSLEALEKKAKEIDRRSTNSTDGSVVLRVKTSASNQSLNNIRTIDGFYSYWMDLRNNLVPNSFSLGELWSIYNLLTTLVSSIGDKANEIGTIIKTATQTQLDQDQKSPAEDQKNPAEDQKDLVKVTVKINESPPINSNVVTSQVKNKETIKQIADIEKEVKALQARVEATSFTKESQELKDIRSALESHKKTLTRLSVYKNEGIRNSSLDLTKAIDETLKLLATKVRRESVGSSASLKRRSTTEAVLNELIELNTKVNDLGATLKRFGTISDEKYDYTKKKFEEYRGYLQTFAVNSNNHNIRRTRDDTLEQIAIYLEDLEEMWDNSQSLNSEAEEKEFKRDLNNLKEKVSRFSGAYKNILYKKLEEGLNKCSVDVERAVKDKDEVQRLKMDIDNSLKILEEKSVKDGQYEGSLKRRSARVLPAAEGNIAAKLAQIREEVESVKMELNESAPKTPQEYTSLDGKLTLSILALDNLTIIKDNKYSSERKQLYDEVHRLLSFINERVAVGDQPSPRITTKEFLQNQPPAPKRPASVSEGLAESEQKLEAVKSQILVFVGLESSEKFFELDETLIQITLKLDNFKFAKGTESYARKIKLLREINYLSDVLDQRMLETEQLVRMEKEKDEMVSRVGSFAGTFEDYNALDEQLINLKIKVGKLGVNEQLIDRKNDCIKEIENCLKRLNEAAGSVKENGESGVIGEGTLV